MRSIDMQDNAELEKMIQDLFSEIRYIAYEIERLAKALKALTLDKE